MSERNPRVIRSQMGDLETPPDEGEAERRLQAEQIERRERAVRQARHDEESAEQDAGGGDRDGGA